MNFYSFYDKRTGTFHRQVTLTDSVEHVGANTPPGHTAIEGRYDALSQRVEIGDGGKPGKVVDWQPPAPSGEHEWDSNARRWRLKPEVVAARELRAAVLSEIGALERAQARPIRELAIDPADRDARNRLLAIEERIVELRRQLNQ